MTAETGQLLVVIRGKDDEATAILTTEVEEEGPEGVDADHDRQAHASETPGIRMAVIVTFLEADEVEVGLIMADENHLRDLVQHQPHLDRALGVAAPHGALISRIGG